MPRQYIVPGVGGPLYFSDTGKQQLITPSLDFINASSTSFIPPPHKKPPGGGGGGGKGKPPGPPPIQFAYLQGPVYFSFGAIPKQARSQTFRKITLGQTVVPRLKQLLTIGVG